MDISKIQGIIFDYGGTIDSRGDHWSEVMLDQYAAAGLQVEWPAFKAAYVDTERLLAAVPLVHSDFTFRDLMELKISLQLTHLAAAGAIGADTARRVATPIARGCYEHARKCIEQVRPQLEALAARYPLVLVSNFYGNVDTVVRDFGLRGLFRGIVESAVVGVRKPDPAIFSIGCSALGLPPEHVLVIGDSISKDILPARSIGCQTALIAGRQWREDKEMNLFAEKSFIMEEIANALL